MAIDLSGLDKAVANASSSLKDALLAMDVWDRSTGFSLGGINTQPAATALFNHITGDIVGILNDSGYPGLNRYYMLDLEDNKSVVITMHSDVILSGMLLDSSRASLGIVVGLVLPKLIADMQAAGA